MGNYAAKFCKSNYKEFENFINLHVRVSILNKFPASFLSALFGFINYFHFKTIDVVCAYLPGFILYFTFFLYYKITNSIFIKKAYLYNIIALSFIQYGVIYIVIAKGKETMINAPLQVLAIVLALFMSSPIILVSQLVFTINAILAFIVLYSNYPEFIQSTFIQIPTTIALGLIIIKIRHVTFENNFLEKSINIQEKEIAYEKLEQLNLTLQDKIAEAVNKIKKQQAELLQSAKLASIGRLVGGIAHELRNPLNFLVTTFSTIEKVLNGLLEINKIYSFNTDSTNKESIYTIEEKIKLSKFKKRKDKSFEYYHQQLDRITEMVNDLVNFTRDASDKPKQPYQVSELINKAIKLIPKKALTDKNIKLSISCDSDFTVICNENQIYNVLLNILTNAIDAIIDSSGQIIISTELIADNTTGIINIEDNGKGVKNEDLDKIFDPFYTTKDIGKGTGLGLSISYEIMNIHKGKIKVLSTPKEKTVFSLSFPICQSLEKVS